MEEDAARNITQQGTSPEKTPKTPLERIYGYTAAAIGPYKGVLTSDAQDERVSDLGTKAKDLLTVHLDQLDALRKLLREFIVHRDGFKQYVRQVKLLDERIVERETFTARFGPKERLPVGSDNPQIQLSLHGNISANDPETIAEALYSLGMSGSPDKTIAKLFRQSTEQMVELNTVGVYIDPQTETNKVIPRAGISFRWKNGEDRARVGGIVFIGHQIHSMELLKSIPLPEFSQMQRTVMDLSGYKPKVQRLEVGK